LFPLKQGYIELFGAKSSDIAMARAKRHYIPGQIWHITHRCHKREFLLKFAKDRRRWLQWLFEARRRYGLSVLNYTVTSNHIHLLVADDKSRGVILEAGESFQLKEVQYPYIAHFGAKKSEIGAQNTYVWDQNFENATT